MNIDINQLVTALNMVAGNTVTKDALPNATDHRHVQGHEGVIFSHLFRGCGLDKEIINTLMQDEGIVSCFPVVKNNLKDIMVGYLTGYQRGPVDDCQDCDDCTPALPAGEYGICRQVLSSGCFKRRTTTFNVQKLIIEDRCDINGIGFMNNPISNLLGGIFANWPVSAETRDMLTSELANRLNLVARELHADISEALWTGNGVGDTIKGFEHLIKVGHQDVETCEPCPSLDSIICDLNCCPIGAKNVAASTRIVQQIISTFHNLRNAPENKALGQQSGRL